MNKGGEKTEYPLSEAGGQRDADAGAATGGRLAVTRAVLAGTRRLLQAAGMSVLVEVPLKNGRRADIMALGRDGGVVIVEVKSSPADFRADGKWQEYLPFCDLFYFAAPPDMDRAVLPAEEGLIVADRWDGMIVREAPMRRLAAARRRALMLSFAHLAAARLARSEERETRLRRETGLSTSCDRSWHRVG